MRGNPLPSSTLFCTSPFTITICGENGDERRYDNNSNGEKRVSGGCSSKIEVRCFSDSGSAARYLSVNDDGSCNNNDVWCGDNSRNGERKRLTIGSSCNKEVNRSSESSSEHNGVGS